MRKIEVDLGELIDICVTLFTGSFERDYVLELLPQDITESEKQEFLERYRKPPYGEEDTEEITKVLEEIHSLRKTARNKNEN